MTTVPCDENLRITGGAEGSAPPLLDREKQVLTFSLKKEWYEKIRSGEKTVEYREVKPYWTKRLELYGREPDYLLCKLTLGYTKNHMTARITEIATVDGKDTDLAIDAPVYAIHLADVHEGGKK